MEKIRRTRPDVHEPKDLFDLEQWEESPFYYPTTQVGGSKTITAQLYGPARPENCSPPIPIHTEAQQKPNRLRERRAASREDNPAPPTPVPPKTSRTELRPTTEPQRSHGVTTRSYARTLQQAQASAPLKRYFNLRSDRWLKSHPDVPMNICDIPTILKEALPLTAMPVNIQKGFAVTGSRKQTVNRRKCKSAISTDSPIKSVLEDEAHERKDKKQRAGTIMKKLARNRKKGKNKLINAKTKSQAETRR
ncbi:hypothetical protein ILUMI_11845 [Ignelater luminosus]|uniref:Uncharacterized protein n=1 Tax=Ignelater luminosus TaxID=2038154 RepID=A0A8K0G7C3_IGNLU|nr:hypothetical protein ILUMI_11845 [Ignelater luminosus]